jgi:hypothetical protein
VLQYVLGASNHVQRSQRISSPMPKLSHVPRMPVPRMPGDTKVPWEQSARENRTQRQDDINM